MIYGEGSYLRKVRITNEAGRFIILPPEKQLLYSEQFTNDELWGDMVLAVSTSEMLCC
jgi:hypothetical protein